MYWEYYSGPVHPLATLLLTHLFKLQISFATETIMSTISEVMLDRWLLEQIEEEYDIIEMEKDMPVEELSYETMELLS